MSKKNKKKNKKKFNEIFDFLMEGLKDEEKGAAENVVVMKAAKHKSAPAEEFVTTSRKEAAEKVDVVSNEKKKENKKEAGEKVDAAANQKKEEKVAATVKPIIPPSKVPAYYANFLFPMA